MQGELSSVGGRKCISLSLPKIDMNGFIMQAPMVIVYLYLSCLILLIVLTNTIGTLWDLWFLVWSWCKGKRTLRMEILKFSLRHPVPGCQGVWKDLGRFLGWLLPPVTWDFTLEHVTNPGKLTHQWWKGALPTPVKASNFLPCVGALAVPAETEDYYCLTEDCSWGRSPNCIWGHYGSDRDSNHSNYLHH